MINILRTDAENDDFIALVKHLDADLARRDGAAHPFYSQFNKLDNIKHVIVVYEDTKPVGCGSMKHYEDAIIEIKRMYTSQPGRGKGIASMVLAELEKWAIELSYKQCILETGIKYPEAIGLYKKNGYVLRANYGQYMDNKDSCCFQKQLR
jgi:GNAT superfamily N-acetyltransferase